jgi:hypothetical protein
MEAATDLVRQEVRNAFANLGLSASSVAAMEEWCLVSGGRLTARTYVAGQLRAMWLIDARLIQVYGPQGEMLRTIDLAKDAPPVRKAA